jgi:PIN domain nuclease of toxin-antitoxin system
MRAILLDTRALLWVANGDPVSEEAQAALAEAKAGQVAVSPMSAWEIGQLVARKRIVLPMDAMAWFRSALEAGVALAPLTPETLVASSFLPGAPIRSPPDRIIAATARAQGYRLMTRDLSLLGLAEEGHLQAIPC